MSGLLLGILEDGPEVRLLREASPTHLHLAGADRRAYAREEATPGDTGPGDSSCKAASGSCLQREMQPGGPRSTHGSRQHTTRGCRVVVLLWVSGGRWPGAGAALADPAAHQGRGTGRDRGSRARASLGARVPARTAACSSPSVPDGCGSSDRTAGSPSRSRGAAGPGERAGRPARRRAGPELRRRTGSSISRTPSRAKAGRGDGGGARAAGRGPARRRPGDLPAAAEGGGRRPLRLATRVRPRRHAVRHPGRSRWSTASRRRTSRVGLGKIVRINAGRLGARRTIRSSARTGVRPEIWSYGHRNVQARGAPSRDRAALDRRARRARRRRAEPSRGRQELWLAGDHVRRRLLGRARSARARRRPGWSSRCTTGIR